LFHERARFSERERAKARCRETHLAGDPETIANLGSLPSNSVRGQTENRRRNRDDLARG
jgi:hypothetical protein